MITNIYFFVIFFYYKNVCVFVGKIGKITVFISCQSIKFVARAYRFLW